MNEYLVLLRHSGDDIPVRLFAEKEDAILYAEKRKWRLGKKEKLLFDVNCDTPTCVCIVEYVNGKPVNFDWIKYYQDGVRGAK